MNGDGTLTDAEIRRRFPQPEIQKKYADPGTLPGGTPVVVGDYIRVVAYNEPSYLDSLWDNAQQNAEEHTDEIVGTLHDNGIAVRVAQVTGRDVTEKAVDTKECYVYDFEVVAVFAPQHPNDPQQMGLPTTSWMIALAGVLFGAALIGGEILIAKWDATGLGKGGKAVSNTLFWLSLAAIAVSIAIVFRTAKQAAP